MLTSFSYNISKRVLLLSSQKNYAVHLELLRNDIFGIIQAEVGVQNFYVWIAINRSVNSKFVVEKCGRYTPISAIELEDSLPSSSPIGKRERCWNLGKNTTVFPIQLNISNLQEGIVLNFGTSPCCCCSSNTTYINTTVLLKEGYCQYDSLNSSVISGNIGMLTNCSESNISLQFAVQTSLLCPRHLEWRLSVENTTAFCVETKSNEYKCTIRLNAAAPDAVISSTSMYCQNSFFLWRTLLNGSEGNASLNNVLPGKDIRDSCIFVLDLHDICTFSVVYSYASATTRLIQINGSSSFSNAACYKTCTRGYVVLPCALAFGLGFVIIVIHVTTKPNSNCRKKCRKGYMPVQGSDSSTRPTFAPSRSPFGVDDLDQTYQRDARQTTTTAINCSDDAILNHINRETPSNFNAPGSSEDKQRNDGNLSTKGDGLVSNDTSDSETEQSRVSINNPQIQSDADGLKSDKQENNFCACSSIDNPQNSHPAASVTINIHGRNVILGDNNTAILSFTEYSAQEQTTADAEFGTKFEQIEATVQAIDTKVEAMDTKVQAIDTTVKDMNTSVQAISTTMTYNMSSLQSQMADINTARDGNDNNT
ncbi:uncharacterized protein LOC134188791 isoform X2 [Corticium candelabrum]|uniref:uncharacterized protein LOC134188791 isoform X2 n=1 Tax=Corticium candelabrum TaxID=121492 RepID=UPI002E264CDE|nr:uncharacterized protein LOC134188791 isoform X2 [Corticium candelabrum]